jgi:hypothetical protein
MGDAVAVAKFEANLRVPVWKRNDTAQGRPIHPYRLLLWSSRLLFHHLTVVRLFEVTDRFTSRILTSGQELLPVSSSLGSDGQKCHQVSRCLPRIFPRRSCAQSGLFGPQRDHGVDAHGAAGRDVAGGESDSEKHNRDGCKCEWVTGAHVVEQAGHQTR